METEKTLVLENEFHAREISVCDLVTLLEVYGVTAVEHRHHHSVILGETPDHRLALFGVPADSETRPVIVAYLTT